MLRQLNLSHISHRLRNCTSPFLESLVSKISTSVSTMTTTPTLPHSQPTSTASPNAISWSCLLNLKSLEGRVPKHFLKYPPPDDVQLLVLPDGRHMAYGIYGSQCADADTFIFCHGTPDSRVSACLTPSDGAMAKRLNIRWIGIDRPGFGFSTFLPGRTALGWVDDLRHLIRHLGLRKYRVLGASGGTPYALACAKLLPKDEILSVGVAFGIAPWEAGSKGLSIYNRLGMFIWGHFPNIMAKALDKELVTLVHQHDIEPTLQLTRKFARNTTKKDRELLEQDDQIQGFASIWREVFRQGSSQAWVADSKIATEQWGFELENVGYEGVRLWYGKEDVNTPPNAGRYMADRLPGAVYNEYEGRSHFTMWENIEEILTDMRRDV